uniref:Amino acid transporter transmembrane domain-containing protein n=1 Tax=Hyaloperonospora arabidopsidis (strain Emoy2) TaxID=559515 RepID=M4BQJ4_HYAAE
MRGHPSAPPPDITLHQVLTTFGNLSLAYGASVVVPDLQRQHSEPTRMPRIILVSMGAGSVFFVIVAVVGYIAGGCQLSGNLLFSIVNTSDPTAASALGFVPNRGAVVMAYLFMQTHIVVAFSTIIQPPFYMAERFLLGMHKTSTMDFIHESQKLSSIAPVTPDLEGNYSTSDTSGVPLTEHKRKQKEELEMSEYTGKGTVLRYVTLRLSIIAVLVAASIGLRERFLDLVDFTGASAVTVCCLALPIVFYLKVFWNELPMYERVVACLLILVCSIVGCYVMIYAGQNLFYPHTEEGITFPYCPVEYQVEPYFVRSATTSR